MSQLLAIGSSAVMEVAMNGKQQAFGLLLCLALAFSLGCSGGEKPAQGPQAHGKQARAGGGHGKGDKQRPAQPPMPVAVEAAITGSIASFYTATTTLEAEKEAEILCRITGVIEALTCEEGDQVSRGDALLTIENDEYRLRLSQETATASNLREKYNRMEGMWERKLVSDEEFDQVKNDLKSAEANEELARLNLSYTKVVSPFAGRITRRHVDVGQNVTIGTALFVIADFDPLLARVHVPSKEFKKLKPDQPVELVLDSNQMALQGKITLVSPVIDPTSGTIKVTVEIPEYPSNTRPGDFAKVRIVTEKRTGSVLVPKAAVFTDRGDQIVYLAVDDTAERRVVTQGFSNDEHTEILSGVAQGDQVIVKGQRSLKHGAPIKIMDDQPVSSERPNRQH